MTLIKIADLLFHNATQISFGTRETWTEDTFLASWFKNQNIQQPNASGLYWFLTNATLENNTRPQGLPERACDFGVVSRHNLETFHVNFLPKASDQELKVVYNGHEKNVMSRVRQHFSLNNSRTGALGINHYQLSSSTWVLKYFTINDIVSLRTSELNRTIITNLLEAKTGRTALENAWRIKNGWPILCKE